jgi:hypothetical protein
MFLAELLVKSFKTLSLFLKCMPYFTELREFFYLIEYIFPFTIV